MLTIKAYPVNVAFSFIRSSPPLTFGQIICLRQAEMTSPAHNYAEIH